MDVEITSLVNNTNMGNSVNDEAMATETVPTFSDNVESIEVIETTPVPTFNDAFLAARNELGPEIRLNGMEIFILPITLMKYLKYYKVKLQ